MLESTLILTRQDLLTWASDGTLTSSLSVPGGDSFEWEIISQRDRQLAKRDIVLSNSSADLSALIATIWGRPVQYSAPSEPSGIDIPGMIPAISGVTGTVGHVTNSSTPDASYAADDDLLLRDVILLEGLRQISARLPGSTVGGTISGPAELTSAWSLADGTLGHFSLNPALHLNVEGIKNPDSALAEMDNQLASNIAGLSHILRNPLLDATRIIVQSTEKSHEAESYVIVYEDEYKKVWKAEPGLEGRMTVTYDKSNQSVLWTREDGLAPNSYPQPYSATIPGTTAGDLEILPYIDGRKDSEFWRQKANHVSTLSVRELKILAVEDPGKLATGSVYESGGSAVLTEPGTTLVQLSSGSIPAGLARVALLLTPAAEIVVDGAKGVGGSSTDDTYVDFPPTGGTVEWSVKIPRGNWSMDIYFTNVLGEPSGSWPFLIQLGSDVISNLGLRFTGENGTLQRSSYAVTSDSGESVTLAMTWTPVTSSNQLRISSIVFTKESLEQVYSLEAKIGSVIGGSLSTVYGPEVLEIDSFPHRPDTASFTFAVDNTTNNPGIEITWSPISGSIGLTPLEIDQIDVMAFVFEDPTPNAEGFDGWPSEMADRAVESVIESFKDGTTIDPTFEPTELVGGIRYWTPKSTKSWVELIRHSESRFDLAFRVGGPGDVGCPAISPEGVQFDLDNSVLSREVTLEAEITGTLVTARAVSTLPGTLCYPRMIAFQPWMATVGLPVLREDFWSEPTAKLKLVSITGYSDPAEGGLVSGGGSYPYGSTATLVATPTSTWTFTGWFTAEGDLYSSDATLAIVPVRDIVLEARFTL